MRILHTADWHFGKRIHGYHLEEDMRLFLDWFYDLIEKQNIDVVLISGDVFDLSNPSNADKEMYFNFLTKIRRLGVKTIITGGNHDSVSYLNAPQEYLKYDNIHVVGGATEDLSDEIIPIDINGEKAIICAVPFLRDRDIRHISTEEQFANRQEAIKFGLNKHYADVLALAKATHPNHPVIGMGHLFAIGSSSSDSERDIHIGNSGAVGAGIFDGYDYIALGHIHKPQVIQENVMIRYSGSPIALSFSEKKDEKILLIIEIINDKIENPEIVNIPKFRELIRYSGTLVEVEEKLNNIPDGKDLPTLVEIVIKEDQYSLKTIQETARLIDEFNTGAKAKIVNHIFDFKHGSKNLDELFDKGTDIKDLDVTEVFEKKIVSDLPDISLEDKQELMNTFDELRDLLYNEELV